METTSIESHHVSRAERISFLHCRGNTEEVWEVVAHYSRYIGIHIILLAVKAAAARERESG
jgi:hypothetical protein